jgi:hypothetical protein
MGNSKIIYGGKTLIDLTGDTIKKDKLLKGYTAHGADGEPIVGECEFDANTQDATATPDEVLDGKTFYKNGKKETGRAKNNGAVSGKIYTKDGKYAVEIGYHDGSGTVEIDATEKAKLIPENIREGVTVLGVAGSMSGSEGMKPQAKEITPSTSEQVVLPDSGYNCLTQVTVKPIPYAEAQNSAGGITVTIG